MKNTVRLNEAQLKQVIVESVKNVLSELDWKTYANAANKTGTKWSETEDAIWRLDDEIGKAQEDGDMEKVKSLKAEQERLENVLAKHMRRYSDFNDAADKAFTQKHHLDYYGTKPDNFQRLPGNAQMEKFNFNVGNYDYDSENGWHLKESVNKTVKSVLREYLNKNK